VSWALEYADAITDTARGRRCAVRAGRERYDEEQIAELTMLIGGRTRARTLNRPLRVPSADLWKLA
jgi:hypothetical protein